jgi:hypothetical protein
MKKNILILIAVVIVALIVHQSIGFGQVKSAPQKLVPTDLKATVQIKGPINKLMGVNIKDVMGRWNPNLFDSGNVHVVGQSNAAYNLNTGEMWITAIGGAPRAAGQPQTRASVSFQSSALVNAGTVPWKGVTVTAELQVINISGEAWPGYEGLCVFSFGAGGAINGQFGNQFGNSCFCVYGCERGDVSTNCLCAGALLKIRSLPVDVPPGATFQPVASVVVNPFGNRSSGIYAKLLSITINQATN